MKHIFTHSLFFPLIFCVFFSSCLSTKFPVEEGALIKNWDTVNGILDYYRKKPFETVTDDFGNDYAETEDGFCTFYSPSGDSFIIFAVKKEKVIDYFYDGSYTDLTAFVGKLPQAKEAELQMAANVWLGFSPDLLKETFGSLVFSSTDKLICVGSSEESCIEYSVGTVASGDETDPSNGKAYIKKAELKGTYDELNGYLLPVPQDSKPVKKVKQKN